MKFLNPTIDIVFKKLFGTTTHKDILMSFLNSVLGRTEGNLIVDVVFNDPTNLPETMSLKESIVDVRCTDQAKNQYIIEMQVSPQKDYGARAQYYSALALSRQLEKNQQYEKLVPVIFIGILDFKLFECSDYISHHYVLNTKTHEKELKHLEFHFIELPKFKKKIEELHTVLDKWIYFLNSATDLRKIPETFEEQPVFNNAFHVLEEGSWSRRDLEAYDRYLDAIRSEYSKMKTAEEIGMERGIEKGIEKGIERGKIEFAQQLLDILDVETISKKSGLSITVIRELKKNIQDK